MQQLLSERSPIYYESEKFQESLIKQLSNAYKPETNINTYLQEILKKSPSYIEPDTIEVEKTFQGTGAFSEAYKGKYKDKNVAIKVFINQIPKDQQSVMDNSDFLSQLGEIDSLNFCGKEGVRNVIGFFGFTNIAEHPDDKFNNPTTFKLGIVMELAQYSLKDLIIKMKQKGIDKFSKTQILYMFNSLTETLTDLQGRKVIHRDIKLDNILVLNCDDFKKIFDIKLTDFSESQSLKNLKINQIKEYQSRVKGTKTTMSPESLIHIISQSPDKKLDLEINNEIIMEEFQKIEFRRETFSLGMVFMQIVLFLEIMKRPVELDIKLFQNLKDNKQQRQNVYDYIQVKQFIEQSINKYQNSQLFRPIMELILNMLQTNNYQRYDLESARYYFQNTVLAFDKECLAEIENHIKLQISILEKNREKNLMTIAKLYSYKAVFYCKQVKDTRDSFTCQDILDLLEQPLLICQDKNPFLFYSIGIYSSLVPDGYVQSKKYYLKAVNIKKDKFILNSMGDLEISTKKEMRGEKIFYYSDYKETIDNKNTKETGFKSYQVDQRDVSVKLEPDDFYYCRVRPYLDLDQITESQRYYNEALQIDEDFYRVYFNKGNIEYDINQDFKKAKDLYDTCIKKNSTFTVAFYQRGCLNYYEFKDEQAVKQAVEDFNTCIGLVSHFAPPYVQKAKICHYSMDKYEEAQELYSKAINLEPKYPEPHYHRANLNYFCIKDYRNAELDYLCVIINLDPEFPTPYYLLARLYHYKTTKNRLNIIITKLQFQCMNYKILNLQAWYKKLKF